MTELITVRLDDLRVALAMAGASTEDNPATFGEQQALDRLIGATGLTESELLLSINRAERSLGEAQHDSHDLSDHEDLPNELSDTDWELFGDSDG